MNPLMDPTRGLNLNFGATGASNQTTGPGGLTMAMPEVNSSTMGQIGAGTVASSPLVPQNILKAIAPSVPGGAGGAGGWLSKIGGLEGIGSLAQMLGSLGQTYAAIKGIGVAKDQLNFSKEAYKTNLDNTTQAYNTTLEGRTRAQYHTEGRGAGEVDKYLAKHAL